VRGRGDKKEGERKRKASSEKGENFSPKKKLGITYLKTKKKRTKREKKESL